nr:MAG TPA: hypothetical protein [Caudoviricetes sp.]
MIAVVTHTLSPQSSATRYHLHRLLHKERLRWRNS